MRLLITVLCLVCLVATGVAVGVWVLPGNTFSGNQTSQADLAVEFAGLSDEQQQHIWQLEHYTFQLENKFGKQLTEAMKQGESAQLKRFLLDDFSAQLPDEDQNHDDGVVVGDPL